MPAHVLYGVRGQVVPTGSLSGGTLRNMIDTYGFAYKKTAARAPINIASPIPLTYAGTVNTGAPPSPTGLFNDIIRDGINAGLDWLGGLGGGGGGIVPFVSQEGDPIGDVWGFPDPLEGLIKGTLPRGAVNFITMPDGRLGCPSGWHPEKSNKGYCVRNRRMNALNPRALSRASRRVGGFARAVKRARTLKKVCKTL